MVWPVPASPHWPATPRPARGPGEALAARPQAALEHLVGVCVHPCWRASTLRQGHTRLCLCIAACTSPEHLTGSYQCLICNRSGHSWRPGKSPTLAVAELNFFSNACLRCAPLKLGDRQGAIHGQGHPGRPAGQTIARSLAGAAGGSHYCIVAERQRHRGPRGSQQAARNLQGPSPKP